eukprot:gb/GEZJ01000968.1/.p3 GENE.gb/GEZJ01000968.1/~~gb/GEZJ01000968.1/.p3  ORF type:complete len:206 (+),score=20.53 gb/GEZJ01000968.1/:1476-2093(+)
MHSEQDVVLVHSEQESSGQELFFDIVLHSLQDELLHDLPQDFPHDNVPAHDKVSEHFLQSPQPLQESGSSQGSTESAGQQYFSLLKQHLRVLGAQELDALVVYLDLIDLCEDFLDDFLEDGGGFVVGGLVVGGLVVGGRVEGGFVEGLMEVALVDGLLQHGLQQSGGHPRLTTILGPLQESHGLQGSQHGVQGLQQAPLLMLMRT